MLVTSPPERSNGPAKEGPLLNWGTACLLANRFGILGFGLIVAAFPQVFPDFLGGQNEGLLRATGVATTGLGILGIMVSFKLYRQREKWAWFTLWYYPAVWTLHLIGGLPPGKDHIHQVVFPRAVRRGTSHAHSAILPETTPTVKTCLLAGCWRPALAA